MAILKALKHKYCLSLGTCHKHVVQFTDPSHTIYWYAKRAKLTVFEIQLIFYRPDFHNSLASRKKLKNG